MGAKNARPVKSDRKPINPPPIPSTPYGITITTQLAHVLAARPTREMTLDCRTLWSVRFCAAKGHFCSLLLSNILVTSAFCRLTIFSIWSSFRVPYFYHVCPFMRDALEGWNLFQSINRLAVSSETLESAFLWLLSTTLRPYFSFRKNGGRKSFFYERCFPFVTI